MGKDGSKDITKKPVAIVKLFEGWFVRKNPKDQIWLAVGNMPAAFKAKPPETASEVSPIVEPEPEPRQRLRGKGMDQKERLVQRFIDALVRWLGGQPQRTATAAAIMRFLRHQDGFVQFARQNPAYNRFADIATENPDVFETVSGGSYRNPRIRLKLTPAADKGPEAASGSPGLGALLRSRAAARERMAAMLGKSPKT